MSYQVIARKYRPQRFSDVVGQEHVTRTLTQAIEQNRIAHAYIFCGPRGTGKTTVARIFAKCLNCTDGPKADFDDQDPRCREIAEGRSLDVLEIDGASNNGVEQVRELRETCRYAPASGRFKIYIIDEVHMLSTAAFNALLKTLEEPPAHVKFLFATTDPEKVLPTILSRCQRFDLRRIPSALIVQHLSHIARQENVRVAPAALQAIARGADGGMRDAESTLDQLISFCGTQIEESDVLSMFGLTAQSQILDLCRHILSGELHPALHQMNDLAQSGKDLGRLVSDLLNFFRNLLIFKVSKGDVSMLEISEDEERALKEQAELCSTDGLTRILEVFTETEWRLKEASSKKILLELAVVKAAEARNAVSIDAVIKQLGQLRSATGTTGIPTAAPAPPAERQTYSPSPSAAPKRASAESSRLLETPQPAAPSTARTPDDLEGLWADLVEAAGRASPFVKTYLVKAHPVSFAKGIFTIGFDPEFDDERELADSPKVHTLLQTKIHEHGHQGVQFRIIKSPAPEGRKFVAQAPEPESSLPPSNPPPQASRTRPAQSTAAAPEKPGPVSLNKEDFKNDPLIQKALELFKAQVVQAKGI